MVGNYVRLLTEIIFWVCRMKRDERERERERKREREREREREKERERGRERDIHAGNVRVGSVGSERAKKRPLDTL